MKKGDTNKDWLTADRWLKFFVKISLETISMAYADNDLDDEEYSYLPLMISQEARFVKRQFDLVPMTDDCLKLILV